MRTIKFRAWDKEKKLITKSFSPWKMTDALQIRLFDETMIPMQFTGLKDKNGKEIYEGDIVKFEMTREELVDHPIMTAFENKTAIYQGIVKWGKNGWRPFIDGEIKNLEVIGNIYEIK